MKNVFKIRALDQRIAPGRIIIASPELSGFFKRSVVLITEHSSEGSMGFVLNKTTNTLMYEVISNLEPRNRIHHLMLGGPTDFSTLHYIHVLGERIPDSHLISASWLYLGGNYEALVGFLSKEFVSGDQIRFLVGHAAWKANQLVDEINQKMWAITDINEAIAFSDPPQLWRLAVEQLGQRYSIWLNYPESPDMN